MIVRQFLQWIRTARSGERAEAASALARAYLYSDLPDDEREAIAGVLIMLADDVVPAVRTALAEALAASHEAPSAAVHALAHDSPDIAAIVLEQSPLFIDAELVDFVATGAPAVQAAIARRRPLACPVAAALAEVGGPEACLLTIENPAAEIAPLSFERLAERFGDLAAVREALFARSDLPIAVRQSLVVRLSSSLATFVGERSWVDGERARNISREACEKATIALAAQVGERGAGDLVRHLRQSGQLTAGLILRALLSGNIALFEEALADLADVPLRRARLLVHDRTGVGLRAIFSRAGLPASTFLAFRYALEAWREGPDLDGSSRLHRRMTERVLTACERADIGEVEPLMALLRRFAAEAAREEALIACARLEHELSAEEAETEALIAAAQREREAADAAAREADFAAPEDEAERAEDADDEADEPAEAAFELERTSDLSRRDALIAALELERMKIAAVMPEPVQLVGADMESEPAEDGATVYDFAQLAADRTAAADDVEVDEWDRLEHAMAVDIARMRMAA